MSTLADEFLADLDQLEEEDNLEKEQQLQDDGMQIENLSDEDGEENKEKEEEKILEESVQDYVPDAVKHLIKDPQYVTHMENVRKLIDTPAGESKKDNSINLEDDPEYAFILKTNNLLSQIGEEISAIHHAVTLIYSKKFPELDSLIPNKLDYLKVVSRIGNETDMSQVKLDDILPPSQVMIVSITGSTTNGEPLSPSALSECLSLASEALRLDSDRASLLRFIESRMLTLAPNVSALVGTYIAARLIGQVGGLQALSRMPACNVMLVGQQKQLFESMDRTAPRHSGILFQSDLVQGAPSSLRVKVSRVLANKVTLAARLDAQGVKGNEMGDAYRKGIEEKVAKWEEPTPGMREKALPVPKDEVKKRRGGRRVRKMKEARQLTEMQKLLNKRRFGVAAENYADEAMGLENGMLEDRGSFRRVTAKKMKLSQKTLKRLGQASKKGYVSGLASSFNLADAQGIELISSAKREEKTDGKYFSAVSGFSSVHPQNSFCVCYVKRGSEASGCITSNCSFIQRQTGYVRKRNRTGQDSTGGASYSPELNIYHKWDEVEISDDLKRFSKQSFTPKSKIPTKVFKQFKTHTNVVNNVRWHPIYGHLLASSSLDHTARIFSVFDDMGEVLSIKHTEGVKDVQWTCDGLKLLSGGMDNYVNVTDLGSGKIVHSYKHNEWISSLCPHPTDINLFLSGASRRGIVCWDMRTNHVIREYFGRFGEVEDMTFLDRHGYSFVSTADIIRRNSLDQGIIVWDFKTGARLSNQVYIEGYTCYCVRKHPLDDVFIAQSSANYIALFQTKKPYRMDKKKRFQGHESNGFKIGCSFSPDGKIVVSSSYTGELLFYSYESSDLLDQIKLDPGVATLSVSWHPLLTSTIAVSSWDGKITIMQFILS